jgi:hypothetical protein
MLAFAFLRFLLVLLLCGLFLSRLCLGFRPPPALGFDLLHGAQAKGGQARRDKCANTRAHNTTPGRLPAHGADEIIEAIAFHWTPQDTAVQTDQRAYRTFHRMELVDFRRLNRTLHCVHPISFAQMSQMLAISGNFRERRPRFAGGERVVCDDAPSYILCPVGEAI